MTVTYTETELDRIARWLAEGLSAGTIASVFSQTFWPVSRSAIVGLVHRNRRLKAIGFRRAPTAAPTAARTGARTSPAVTGAPPRPRTIDDAIAGRNAPVAPGASPLGRLLADLDWRDCRFPLRGDGAATRFCGAPAAADSRYCGYHHTLCHGAGPAQDMARRPAVMLALGVV